MDTREYYEIFEKNFPFWDVISEDDRQFICDNTHAFSYGKGVNIHDSTECSGVILVRKGTLRLYMMSDDGKDITLYRLHEGDMCMLSASCVLNSITFDVFVDSEDDSECLIVSGYAFKAVSERNVPIKMFWMETALSRFSDVMWVMQQILFMSMDKRLSIFLLDESSRLNTDTITLTHEQIAKYIGSAREVVSRMLKYFSSEGLVELSRKGVRIIDRRALSKLALE